MTDNLKKIDEIESSRPILSSGDFSESLTLYEGIELAMLSSLGRTKSDAIKVLYYKDKIDIEHVRRIIGSNANEL